LFFHANDNTQGWRGFFRSASSKGEKKTIGRILKITKTNHIFVHHYGTHLKTEIMIVVSTRKFREKQGEYLCMAKNGEDIVVKSRENGSFKIVPVTEDDAVIDKRDIMIELKGALQQVKDHLEGKTVLKSADSLLDEIRNCTL
jgi:antitoxin (DNA-binding transcriptional repressor) of toxin-antitoxin stability system